MLALAVALAVFLSDVAPAAAAQPEHEVKAEFIERFTRFVDWPAESFATADAPFVVCVAGEGPLVAELGRVISRGRIKERPTRLVHVAPSGDLEGCHLLYVSKVERRWLERIARQIRGRPILSIADQPGLADEGLVIINLVLDAAAYVRFEINREAATDSGLRVSAKLMSLAKITGVRR